jgi:hypothetical protein
MSGLVSGALAGAAGTAALNAVTYADMALRARPGSQVPERLVGEITDRAGVSLGEEETADDRRQALGALMGFAVGIGVGAAYGLVRSPDRARTLPDALGLGAAASVASDGPAIALGITDPRSWGASGWISDVVPHLAYGVVTAATYRRLTGR